MSKRQKPDQKQLFNSLTKDFHELVSNKQQLRTALDHFFNNLVDEMVLGIIFDLHRKHKTNAYDLDVDLDQEENKDVEMFAQHTLKKTQDCLCPNCDRAVAASRFAPHLEVCMGMGRLSRSRNATRRVTTNNKEREGSLYSGAATDDDDDDADWNFGDKRRKKKKARNGSKKPKGTPKKSMNEDGLNVDVEGEEDDLTNLRDILHLQDHSNSTSPVDSATSSHSGSSKKKEKTKNKKNSKRDRSSPSTSISVD